MTGQVLLIVPWASVGGTERHVATLSDSLRQRGWQVTIASPPGPAQEWWRAAGAGVCTFPGASAGWRRQAEGCRTIVGQWWNQTLMDRQAGRDRGRAVDGRPGSDQARPVALSDQPGAGQARADAVVHIHAAPEYLLFLRSLRRRSPSLPVVFTSHGFAGTAVGWDYWWAAFAARRWADAVIAVSQAEGSRLVRAGLPPGRLTVIGNAVPIVPARLQTGPAVGGAASQTAGTPEWAELPEAATASAARSLPFTIGFVGRLSPEKGVPVLIEAVRRWEPGRRAGVTGEPERVRLLIVGEGAQRSELERQAAALQAQAWGVQVEFVGKADPNVWWSKMDVVVVPSLADASPLVVLEAMAAGRAVITSDLPGMLEMVHHAETGWVVPAGDASALAEALAQLAGHPELRRRLGRRAREYVRLVHSAETMAAATEKVYRWVVERRGVTRGDSDTRS
ncbi:MAG: glycosyltransferase family 4 protein [Limnochordaceae bacterium]|nr:glycosyltransferase family 4 protein [Limnochordaceae bacterium]